MKENKRSIQKLMQQRGGSLKILTLTNQWLDSLKKKKDETQTK